MEESRQLNPAGRRHRRSGWRIAFLTVASLAAMVVLFHLEERWRATRAWEAYKRQEIARGDNFDPKRLIPPAVPDEQNFAMTPCLAPLSDLSLQATPFNRTNGVWLATAILPETNQLPRGIAWPPGEAHDMRAWAMAFQQKTNSPAVRGAIRVGSRGSFLPRNATFTNSLKMPGSEKEAALMVLENLKSFEPILAELQTAKTRPYCQFAIRDDWSNAWPHLTALHGLSEVLSLHTAAEMAAGQSDEAFKEMELALYLCETVKDEALLTPHLSRQSWLKIALHTLAQGLAQHCWSEPQLAALQKELERVDLPSELVHSLYGERDLLYNRYFDTWGGIMSLKDQTGPPLDEDPAAMCRLIAAWLLIPEGWIRFEQLNYNRLLRDTILPRIDLARGEITPAASRQCDAAWEAQASPPGWHMLFDHTIFATMLLPAEQKSVQKTAFAQNNVTMGATACALARYRLAMGEYPAVLKDLLPRFMARLPHDIINGQPLKYRRESNDSFLLYSVGWNEKDDGGVIGISRSSPFRQGVDQGDWVWEH